MASSTTGGTDRAFFLSQKLRAGEINRAANHPPDRSGVHTRDRNSPARFGHATEPPVPQLTGPARSCWPGFAAGIRRCRNGRDRGVGLRVCPRHDTFILLDGALRVNASERVDRLVANGTPPALGISDGCVVMPGVHWVRGSSRKAKEYRRDDSPLEPPRTSETKKEPDKEPGRAPWGRFVERRARRPINSAGRRRRHRSRRHRHRHRNRRDRRRQSDRRRHHHRSRRHRRRFSAHAAWPR